VIVEPAKLDATQYIMHYELLRSQVVATMGNAAPGITGQPRGVGLTLLLSEGMPGWLKTVEGVLRASLAPPAVDSWCPSRHENLPRYSAAPGWLSSVPLQEVTTLLTSLVLSTRPATHEGTREGYR
jgi:hypothetical protein